MSASSAPASSATSTAWGPAPAGGDGDSFLRGMQQQHPRPRASLASLTPTQHTRSSSVASADVESSPLPAHPYSHSTSRLRLNPLQETKHQQRRPSLPFPLLAIHNFKVEKRRRSAPKPTAEQDESIASSPSSSRRGSMAVALQMHPLAGPSTGMDMVSEGSGSVQGRRAKTKARSESVIQREREAVEKWRKWALEQQAPPSPTYDKFSAARRTSAPATAVRYRTLSSSPSDPALSMHPYGFRGDLTPTPQRTNSDKSQRSNELPHLADDDPLRFSSFDDLAVDPTKINATRPPVRPRVSALPNPLVPLQKMLGARRTRPLMIELIHSVALYIDAVWAVHRRGARPPGQTPTATAWVSPTLVAIAQAREQGILPIPNERDIAFYGTEVQEAVAEVEEALGGGKWSFARYLVDGGYGSVTIENAGGSEAFKEMGMIRLLGDMEDVLWGDAPPRPTDVQFEVPADFDPSAPPAAPTTDNITALCDFLAEAPRQGLSAPLGAETERSSLPSLKIPELASTAVESGSSGARGSDALLEEGRRRHRAWLEANATG